MNCEALKRRLDLVYECCAECHAGASTDNSVEVDGLVHAVCCTTEIEVNEHLAGGVVISRRRAMAISRTLKSVPGPSQELQDIIATLDQQVDA